MSLGKYTGLLKSFGFQSFLWTQFLGAFNDNVFKIVLSMIAVNLAAGGEGGGGYVSLVGAIFIFPFFLFSGYAGFVADVYNKRSVLIVTKSFEVVAVSFGFVAFLSGRIELMLLTLFFMAMHSTFFGPAKYGIVPEMLPEKEISRANGLLEMSTFFAIILGTSVGTIMFSAWKDRLWIIGAFLIAIAVVGTVMSFGIQRVPGSGTPKPFRLNPYSEIFHGIKRLYRSSLLLFTVIGITYFWFLGSLLQMDILLLGKEVMGLTDFWIGILITFLAIGIGAGSVAAGRLSGDKVEPGLVPLGSIGMGLFAILLANSSGSYPRTAASMMMLGFCGGLFIVPLNSLLQQKSGSDEKGRIIATNNFINTGGILLASAVLWILRDIADIQADTIIYIFGCITLFSTVFVVKALPDFLLRFVLWMLTHTLYKIRIVGTENVPYKGGALLVSNHMSFADALLVGASVHRFIRFMIYSYFYNMKPIRWFLRLMKAIPIGDGNRREVLKSIERAREEIRAGHIVCIFAEGAISRTGNLLPFKKGLERIVEGLDVPVIPVHLDRVWGSVFSFKGGRFFWKWPARFPYPVTVSFGSPMPSRSKAAEIRQAVMELGSEAVRYRRHSHDLLHLKFIKNAKRRWRSLCMADSTGTELTWGKTLVACLLLSGWLRRSHPSEEKVAVLLPSSVGGALANIASLMAGKPPVNLNFTAGPVAMRHCLDKCGIKTVITSRRFLSKAGIEETGEMVFLEDILGVVSGFKKAAVGGVALLVPARLLFTLFCRGKNGPDDLATVIFTSGSTGEPKGVMLSHNNILSNIEGFSQVFNLTARDSVLGVLPFFHSFGFTGTIWFPLLSGIGVRYHTSPADARTVGEMALKYGSTILISTPTFYSAYTKKCSREEFSSLRYAITGAEKLRKKTAEEFEAKFGIPLLEGYGCTELSPVVSVNVPNVEHENQVQKGFVRGTVGHAIPGVSVKVVDPETWTDTGTGDEGLLMVKGPGLMLGYLNDPEMTQNAVRDGWYATGDIASIGADGFIRIVDRLARFSKIAGEMVPHAKVEDAVSEVFGCECAAVSLPDEARGERLLLFCSGLDKTSAEIREALQKTDLPRLWIPRKENIHIIDELPRTGTGKLDFRALKKLAEEFRGV
jgi:acyl-[acyl-carrier-protein]-phospholipid O-acyltransferase/long-chain-fatty-acid--[acyl-carrier-protein] ligase